MKQARNSTLWMLAVAAALMVSLGAFAADVNWLWTGESAATGGWNNPANWSAQSAVGYDVPGADDIVTLGSGQTLTVTDDDAAMLSALKYVSAGSSDSTLILNVTTNTVCGAAFRGNGKFIKRGAGDLELTSEYSSGVTAYGGATPVYFAKGGIVAEEGALVLAQGKANNFNYLWASPMVVSNGAQLVVHDYINTRLLQLTGDGIVTNRGATVRTVNLGSTRNTMSSTYGVPNTTFRFGGSFLGSNLRVEIFGRYDLDGIGSTCARFVGHDRDMDTMEYGIIGIRKFGLMSDESSSIGAGERWFSGNSGFIYLGDEDEVTDKGFSTKMESVNGGYAPFTMHGGHRGGLTLNGNIQLDQSGLVGTFVLDGSNSVPCVISRAFNAGFVKNGVRYDATVVKRGSGIWRFEEYSGTGFSGLIDVQEGTLQFNTLTNAGRICALGMSTNLTENRYGPWDASKTCDYAIRLGTTSDAAPAVLEFVGSKSGTATNRFVRMFGDGHIRASGIGNSPLSLSGVSASSEGSAVKVLTLDGASTATNEVKEVSDGDGKIKVVKDGSGLWRLGGNQTFTGGIAVSNGTLVVASAPAYTYFRVSFPTSYTDASTSYIRELALYDARGTRLNRGLEFDIDMVESQYGKTWNENWMAPTNAARYLAPGKMTYENVYGWANFYIYDTDQWGYGPLSALTDGENAGVKFTPQMSRVRVAMRLTNTTAVAYVDFAQSNEANPPNTPSALTLEGSLDGINWKTLVETNNLAQQNSPAGRWYFSSSAKTIAECPGDRTLGDGEGLALTVPAIDGSATTVLEELGAVYVAHGATLKTEGSVSPVITKLVIDGTTGVGTISGFTFGENVVVDVVNIGDVNAPREVDADFESCTGFSSANLTFTVDGAPSDGYRFKFGNGKLRISRIPGMMIMIR